MIQTTAGRDGTGPLSFFRQYALLAELLLLAMSERHYATTRIALTGNIYIYIDEVGRAAAAQPTNNNS